jgi:uridine kinase
MQHLLSRARGYPAPMSNSELATLSAVDLALEIGRRWKPKGMHEATEVYCLTGHGALGKSTICSWLARSLGWTHLALDRFALNRNERLSRGWSGYNPHAFAISNMIGVIERISAGAKVYVPYYSHKAGESCTNNACGKHPHWLGSTSAPLIIEEAFMWDTDFRVRVTYSIFFDYNCPVEYWNWRRYHDFAERGYGQCESTIHTEQLKMDTLLYIARSKPYCNNYITVKLPQFVYTYPAQCLA